MRKLFTLTLALLASFSLWAVDLSKGATYDLTTLSTSDFTGTIDNYWKPDNATPTYYGNGSSFKPTSASDFILNANNDKITKLDGLKLITGSSSGRARLYVNGNGLYFNSTDAKLVIPGLKAGQEIVLTYANASSNEANFTLTNATGVQNTTAKTETLTVTANGDVTVTYSSKKFYIKRIEISSSCQAADATFSATSTALVITNEVPAPSTALNFTKGSNTSDPTYSVTKDGETTTDASVEGATFTATAAGTYTVTATQVADGTYCEVIKQVTITVTAEIPVTDCSIEGPTAGIVGQELTYTATAANATAYEWYLDGVKQGSDSAKFIYTAVKGNHTIVCKARNQFNVNPYPEWVSSEAKALTITNPIGTLITYTLTGGTVNNANIPVGANNIVGGTANAQTEAAQKGPEGDKGYKLGSAGHFIQLTLASGSFLAGDTVCVYAVPEDKDVLSTLTISSDKDKTDVIGSATGLTNETSKPAKIVLTKGATDVYLSRPTKGDQNPVVKYMSVIRPMATKSTVEDLSAVTIDGNPFDPAALSSLKTNHSFNVEGSYVNAPEVKFFKEITITYEDDSEKVMNDSIVVTATENAGGKWEAQATINEVEYTITMGKATSHVVTYMFGTTELGTENVEVGGNPANYATYQTLNDGNLSTFNGWYSKSDLSGDAVTIASAPITKDTTFYASFTYKYATSVNMENFAKNNAKGETNSKALISSLGTYKYASNISYVSGTNEIDSLRADKITGNRNYPYLGLKVKTSGALINFRLEEGKTVKVKFGNVGATPLVSINGGEYAAMTITNSVYTYTATVDGELVSIKTASAAAVVFQQIAIDEELANPELFAVTCAAAENGTVTSNRQLGIPGETVTLTLTPADGYKVANVKVNDGEPLAVSENTATFTMPAADANVVATFSVATALDNTADEIKAVKFVENGQLFIRRGEKVYTITGEEVK